MGFLISPFVKAIEFSHGGRRLVFRLHVCSACLISYIILKKIITEGTKFHGWKYQIYVKTSCYSVTSSMAWISTNDATIL